MSPDRGKILCLVGPTAAGKTAAALAVAEAVNGEIVSADAVAVYRGLDIGTAKPDAGEKARAPHHLIDVADPDQDFTAADFVAAADQAIAAIIGRGRRPIVAGGTGLYFKALVHGLFPAPPVDPALRSRLRSEAEADPEALYRRLAEVDPEAAARLAPKDTVRVGRALEVFLQTGRTMSALQAEHAFRERRYQAVKLGLAVDRAALAERIARRTEAMIEAGLVEEVRGLLARGWSPELKPLQSIGYRQIVDHLAGRLSLAEAKADIALQTRRLAKRQMTWFRADKEIRWLPAEDHEAFITAARRFLDEASP